MDDVERLKQNEEKFSLRFWVITVGMWGFIAGIWVPADWSVFGIILVLGIYSATVISLILQWYRLKKRVLRQLKSG